MSTTSDLKAYIAFEIAGKAGMEIQRHEIAAMLCERRDRCTNPVLVEELDQIIQLVQVMPCDPLVFLAPSTDASA